MSVITKGFGAAGTTLIVKGFGQGIFVGIIVKVIYIVSRITNLLQLRSEKGGI